MVDDQIEILALAQRILVAAGYSVELAQNGDIALEVFRRDGPFDLLLTDIVMPGNLQGPALAEAAREIQSNLSVIFMSGNASELSAHGSQIRTGDARLMKPVSRQDLLKEVEAAIGAIPSA